MMYLAHVEPGAEPELAPLGSFFELRPGLYLIESELSRSKLYHRIKWSLPSGEPLLVAPLADAPKFKGMNPGALNWLRGIEERPA